MTADSDSERITRLEAQMAIVERDIRAVFPLVRENGEIKERLGHVSNGLRDVRTEVTDAIKEFRHGLDCLKEDQHQAEERRERVRQKREESERKERQRAEQDRVDRAKTEKRDRWARWVPTAALAAFIAAEVIKQL